MEGKKLQLGAEEDLGESLPVGGRWLGARPSLGCRPWHSPPPSPFWTPALATGLPSLVLASFPWVETGWGEGVLTRHQFSGHPLGVAEVGALPAVLSARAACDSQPLKVASKPRQRSRCTRACHGLWPQAANFLLERVILRSQHPQQVECVGGAPAGASLCKR